MCNLRLKILSLIVILLCCCSCQAQNSVEPIKEDQFINMGFDSASQLKEFINILKVDFEKREMRTIARKVAYPVHVLLPDSSSKFLYTEQEFVESFDLIFSEASIRMITTEPFDNLGGNVDGVSLHNGLLWIAKLPPQGEIKIVAINVDPRFL